MNFVQCNWRQERAVDSSISSEHPTGTFAVGKKDGGGARCSCVHASETVSQLMEVRSNLYVSVCHEDLHITCECEVYRLSLECILCHIRTKRMPCKGEERREEN